MPMTPSEALAYLDQIAAAFITSLPQPAREPMRQVAMQALQTLNDRFTPADHVRAVEPSVTASGNN